MLLAAPALAAPGEDADVRRTQADCTVREVVGPADVPLTRDFSEALLERPDLCAFLARRRGLARYAARALSPGVWRGGDGANTDGVVRLVERAPTRRVYYAEGEHRARALPTLRAQAVVEMYLVGRPGPDGREFTRATLRVCVRAENPVVARAAKALSSLVRRLVRRKLSRALEVSVLVGRYARADPAGFAADVAAFPDLTREQAAALLARLRAP